MRRGVIEGRPKRSADPIAFLKRSIPREKSGVDGPFSALFRRSVGSHKRTVFTVTVVFVAIVIAFSVHVVFVRFLRGWLFFVFV